MSADNWAFCPKCQPDGEDGEPEEGDRFVQPQFREDYEIGIWNGFFEITYTGQCQKCSYRKIYEHQDRLYDL